MKKDKLGRLRIDNGFIYCDGVVVNNVSILEIDYLDDEIILRDKKENEVGTISNLKKRYECILTEEKNNFEFIDYNIINKGKILIK